MVTQFFEVKISKQETFLALKNLIITPNPNTFAGIDPGWLNLYKTDVHIKYDKTPQRPELKLEDILLVGKITTQFRDSPSEENVHIIVEKPRR